jgi:hypothetical protein
MAHDLAAATEHDNGNVTATADYDYDDDSEHEDDFHGRDSSENETGREH